MFEKKRGVAAQEGDGAAEEDTPIEAKSRLSKDQVGGTDRSEGKEVVEDKIDDEGECAGKEVGENTIGREKEDKTRNNKRAYLQCTWGPS